MLNLGASPGRPRRDSQAGPVLGFPPPSGGCIYQLPDALIDEQLREGGFHRLHHEAQSAVSQLLQGVQGGTEVIVGFTRDVQVSQCEVEPVD